FFFSSRRRHTRCYRDWSSDVCSSDLWEVARATARDSAFVPALLSDILPPWARPRPDLSASRPAAPPPPVGTRWRQAVWPSNRPRSEERRVGKEGRGGGWGGLGMDRGM